MNSIFKSILGFHIDLSKIVAISQLNDEGHGRYNFTIDIQLMDKPKYVTSYACGRYFEKAGDFDKTVRQQLLNAWVDYNKSLVPKSATSFPITRDDPLGLNRPPNMPCAFDARPLNPDY